MKTVPTIHSFYLPETGEHRAMMTDVQRLAEVAMLGWIERRPRHFKKGENGQWWFYEIPLGE